MTDRAALRILSAWAVAVLLSAATLVAVSAVVQRTKVQRLVGIGTLMIGTSLTRFASPDPEGGPLLEAAGTAPFLRIGYPRASERQLLDIAAAAAKAGVPKVFIEVNPIVSRFADQPAGCGFIHGIGYLKSRVQRGAMLLALRRGVFHDGLLPVDQYPSGHRIATDVARLYPLSIEGACHTRAWKELVAAHPATEMAFIVMPRGPAARARIGPDAMAVFQNTASAFARALGRPLLVVDPDGSWEAALFADQAHLSRSGAARFQRELNAWRTISH